MNRFFNRVFAAVDGVFARAAAVRNEYSAVEVGFDLVQAELDAQAPGYLPATVGNAYEVLRTDSAATATEWVNPGLLRPVSVSASRDLAATDVGAVLLCNSGSAIVLTVRLNASVAVALYSSLVVARLGAGTVTIAAEGGVTLRSANNLLDAREQYSQITLLKIATDEWLLGGDRG